MNTNNHNSNQRRSIIFGMACVIAGVACFANGVLHQAAPELSKTGERQGLSNNAPNASATRDLSDPIFTSLTPRYVTKPIAEIKAGEEVVTRDTTTREMKASPSSTLKSMISTIATSKAVDLPAS